MKKHGSKYIPYTEYLRINSGLDIEEPDICFLTRDKFSSYKILNYLNRKGKMLKKPWLNPDTDVSVFSEHMYKNIDEIRKDIENDYSCSDLD